MNAELIKLNMLVSKLTDRIKKLENDVKELQSDRKKFANLDVINRKVKFLQPVYNKNNTKVIN